MPWKQASTKDVSAVAKANAKGLRRKPTDAEKALWRYLRGDFVERGTHFRRQVAIGPYIADFCCLRHRLIVELDGPIHETMGGRAHDEKRDAYLRAQGFQVVRFRNEDVLLRRDMVLEAIKAALGGTVNDVVLAVVAGGLGKHLRRRGQDTDGLELKAMVPVSVRTDLEKGALGNRVAAIMAPLPVWCQEPVARMDIVREELKGLKQGGQAVGAQVVTGLSDFAPPTIMDQAARLIVGRQRLFNLVVTNVPGPQFPLYLLGRRMIETFPMVPLAKNQALGIALLSYDGRINFGLLGDYDLLWDLDDIAEDLQESLAEIAEVAGVELGAREAVHA
jgi:WS/DGAT/MGAT family acyltransferase